MIRFLQSLPVCFNVDDPLFLQLLGSRAVGGNLDPDAAAYIARVESEDGQALEPIIRILYSNFFIKQKSTPANVGGRTQWQSMQGGFFAIYCGQRSFGGTQVSLTGPNSINSNFVSGDYSRTEGLKGNGTNKALSYAVSGISIPNEDRSLGVYFTEHHDRVPIRGIMGNGAGLNNSDSLVTSGTTRFWRANGSQSLADTTALPGYYGVSKTGVTAAVRRYAGSSVNTNLTSNGSLIDAPMGVFGRPADFSNGRIIMSHFCLALDMAALEADVAQLQADIIAALS